MRSTFIIKLWLAAYETLEEKAAREVAEEVARKKPKTFTEEEVNAKLAAEKASMQKKFDDLESELSAIKTRTDMTSEERAEAEKRITGLREELQTKERLNAEKESKLKKDSEKRIKSLEDETATWKNRYTTTRIESEIISASGDAYNPEQIIAILQPKTALVDVIGEDGKATGDLKVEVEIKDVDAKGVPLVLKLSPTEAIKRLSENEKYANLFKNKGVPGLGLRNASGQKIDLQELAKDPAAYREAKKKDNLPKK